jgi:hypothetical protein
MKKIIFVLLLLILIPATVLAWDDCPRNEIDCPYPGTCSKYVDTDNDEICDRSQPAPEDRDEETAGAQTIKNNIDSLTTTKQNKTTYHFLPISLILILLYFITHTLSKRKIISIMEHRKIWNILLLISFLISGILGILLIIEINSGVKFSLPFDMLFWHVEVGIAMFVISIFHTLWHWAYFKNMFKVKK